MILYILSTKMVVVNFIERLPWMSDDIILSDRHSFRVSLKGAWQHQKIQSDNGFHALSIYFPTLERTKSDFIWRSALSYQFKDHYLNFSLGLGYGNRAPSVTESFGYFLNNTFDKYDYIGNPNLKKESALELNGMVEWNNHNVDLKVESNVFFLQNYIIGKPDGRLSAMTIGAAGVKVYQNLNNARIVNVTFQGNWYILSWLRLENRLTYSHGVESTNSYLPLIAPLIDRGALKAIFDHWEIEVGMECAGKHSKYSKKYGETETSGYEVFHFSAGHHLKFKGFSVDFHAGIENVLDRKYTTYSDWNHILKKGRNIFINSSFTL